MNKLSDVQVAKALGWKRKNSCWWDGELGYSELPAFTTSLDAIVLEVEARGLDWNLKVYTGESSEAWVWRYPETGKEPSVSQPTAHLALCAALLAYLKENP